MVQTHEQPEAIDFYIGANVDIGPGVVIAAGAILEAAPGARLVVEAGVCIGSEVVIQAFGGILVLAAGANLGKSVLIVGQGRVDARACVGAESTLINPRVEADAVIPARSLLGDVSLEQTATETAEPIPAEQNGHVATASIGETSPSIGETSPSAAESAEGDASTSSDEANDEAEAAASQLATPQIVYGRDQVQQLMKTLFPHRDALNGNRDTS